jgi:hypothetical protein
MMAIYMFVSGLVYFKASKMIGILGVFTLFYTVYIFTPDSYTYLLVSIFYMTFYLLIVVFYNDIKKYKELIYNLLCIFALVNVLWLVLQHYNVFLLFNPKHGGALETGWFANSNEVSVFLAMATPLFFRDKWRYGLIPLLVGFTLAQCVNGVLTSAIISCLYVCYRLFQKYGKKIIPAFIGCFLLFSGLVAGYMAFVHEGGYKQRIEANLAAIELIKEKPVIGWGIGQSSFVVPIFLNGEKLQKDLVQMSFDSVYYNKDFVKLYKEKHNFNNKIEKYWPQLHNDFLQWTVETGFVGLSILLLIIFSHFLSALKSKPFEHVPFLVVLAALITANAFFTLQMGCFLFIVVLFLGFIQGGYVSQRSSHR